MNLRQTQSAFEAYSNGCDVCIMTKPNHPLEAEEAIDCESFIVQFTRESESHRGKYAVATAFFDSCGVLSVRRVARHLSHLVIEKLVSIDDPWRNDNTRNSTSASGE